MLVNAPHSETLAQTRERVIAADITFRFKFVCGGSPIAAGQEAGFLLSNILGFDEKEGVPFIVIKKLN